MKIDVLCSDPSHPVWSILEVWVDKMRSDHIVYLKNRVAECSGGDILFLISCNEIVKERVRLGYKKVLVIHASDLPAGRGWSPLVWQVLEGKGDIVITLFEAADKVDDGPIWKKEMIHLEEHELAEEINAKLFEAETRLMDFAVDNFEKVIPQEQPTDGITFYRKRTSEDSRLDPEKTISAQFNLLRIADAQRFPVFMDIKGCRYKIIIEKMDAGSDA